MKKDKSKDYVAYYEPVGHPNWTKRFSNKKQAEKYILSKCCDTCKKEGLGSQCGCEWLVIPYDKYLKADNHFDLMKAAGWRRIK